MRELIAIRAGICRHCGCTEDDPCRLYTGEPCSWADATRTVCNKPSCQNLEAARKRRAVAARPKRLTPADVHALIRGRGRKRSCRAAKPRGCI
jgi:hypothetical protein